MLHKLDQVEARYERLGELLSNPQVVANRQEFAKTSKEHSDLTPLVETYRRYKKLLKELEEAKLLLAEGDGEMREMAKEEVTRLDAERTSLEENLKILLLPKDPNDEKNVILEIRAGTGGDEAGLFVGDLIRMYSRYAEQKRWRMEVMEQSPAPSGGFKEIILQISGQRVYSQLKYEGGVHRVQRVPATEAQGRIHTSTVTVAVLPEAEEVEVQLNEKDLRIDVFRSSGPGGQSVNTT